MLNDCIKILLIEDDIEDAFLITKNIGCKGECKLIHSETLEEGVTQAQDGNFDVVLLDLNLPDSGGENSIKTIKELLPNTPIIILTGSNDEETALKSLENGASDYLSKGEINKNNLKRIILYSIERNKLNKSIQEREEKLKVLYKELEHKNKLLLDLAITDPLTGLFNRRYIDEAIDKYISNAFRNSINLFYVVLDVDKFKNINDTYGHDAGDTILKQIASVLEKVCRDSDTCGRFGGDEFIAYGNFSEIDDYLYFPKRLMKYMREEKFTHNGNIIDVTISVGISILDKEKNDKIKLFKDADKALYRAKEGGRNKIVSLKGNEFIEII